MKKAIQVQCYSGSRYGERPLSFTLCDETYVVKVVERSWRSPSALHFLVKTAENESFELAYHEKADEWDIKDPSKEVREQ